MNCFTLSNDEVLDCEENRSFPNQTFHLAFEHNPDGTIQSMILKDKHTVDVSQLKIDVKPIVCQAGKVDHLLGRADNRKSCILNGERLSCLHAT